MVLVTGGAGVIGSALVRGLCERGHKVRILALPGDPLVSRLDGLDVEVFYGDITNAASVAGCCDGIDTVFHLAAILLNDNAAIFERINAGGTRNVLNAAKAAGVGHFVFCSSISVTYPFTTPYNDSKREAERIVTEESGDMAWTIVRPTLAYNEIGGEEYRAFVDFLKKWPIGVFVGHGSARKNPVHCDDLMKGFLAIPGNPKALGKTYPFCGGEPISLWDMGRLSLEREGVKRIFVPIPVWLCRLAALFVGKVLGRPAFADHVIAGLTLDALPDWSEARDDLGYAPRGFREGLAGLAPYAGPKP
jgi:nucleoside-diphosphate-sugar epimerase